MNLQVHFPSVDPGHCSLRVRCAVLLLSVSLNPTVRGNAGRLPGHLFGYHGRWQDGRPCWMTHRSRRRILDPPRPGRVAPLRCSTFQAHRRRPTFATAESETIPVARNAVPKGSRRGAFQANPVEGRKGADGPGLDERRPKDDGTGWKEHDKTQGVGYCRSQLARAPCGEPPLRRSAMPICRRFRDRGCVRRVAAAMRVGKTIDEARLAPATACLHVEP